MRAGASPLHKRQARRHAADPTRLRCLVARTFRASPPVPGQPLLGLKKLAPCGCWLIIFFAIWQPAVADPSLRLRFSAHRRALSDAGDPAGAVQFVFQNPWACPTIRIRFLALADRISV